MKSLCLFKTVYYIADQRYNLCCHYSRIWQHLQKLLHSSVLEKAREFRRFYVNVFTSFRKLGKEVVT